MAIFEQEWMQKISSHNEPGSVGRSVIEIQESQLRFLLEHNFKINDIAAMFSCSSLTIQRRMKDYGIQYNIYTDISDVRLDEVVSEIAARLPCCGIRSVQSMLRVSNVVVQRERVRALLHRVDPAGIKADYTEDSTMYRVLTHSGTLTGITSSLGGEL